MNLPTLVISYFFFLLLFPVTVQLLEETHYLSFLNGAGSVCTDLLFNSSERPALFIIGTHPERVNDFLICGDSLSWL
jgi:hypothetical protein